MLSMASVLQVAEILLGGSVPERIASTQSSVNLMQTHFSCVSVVYIRMASAYFL